MFSLILQFLGIYPEEGFNIGDAFIVTLISIVLVFLVLVIIVVISHYIGKGMQKVEASTNILPKDENKLLNEDPDAVIAALTATIDFNKETGKNAKLISIERIDD